MCNLSRHKCGNSSTSPQYSLSCYVLGQKCLEDYYPWQGIWFQWIKGKCRYREMYFCRNSSKESIIPTVCPGSGANIEVKESFSLVSIRVGNRSDRNRVSPSTDPEISDSGFYLNTENIVPVRIIDEYWYGLIVHEEKTGMMLGISVLINSLYGTTWLDLKFGRLRRWSKMVV